MANVLCCVSHQLCLERHYFGTHQRALGILELCNWSFIFIRTYLNKNDGIQMEKKKLLQQAFAI